MKNEKRKTKSENPKAKSEKRKDATNQKKTIKIYNLLLPPLLKETKQQRRFQTNRKRYRSGLT